MAYDFDYGTLNWVKSEIDETLKQARAALEAYVENTDDETQLRFCINYLHQVTGTLHMVELYGASLAAEEMEALALELVEGKISQRDDAYEALMRGIIQLPDYLDRLQGGQRDRPVVLLPLLNDLRAARGQALLSENALFNPDLGVNVPSSADKVGPEAGDIRQLARRLRHDYHLGLLGWFRDRDREASLQKIGEVLGQLRAAASEQDTARLLWVAGGVIEALGDNGLASSVAVKRLVGQVDRQIKQLIDGGESRLIESPPRELLKNLLYYVAQSDSAGSLVSELKRDFRLDTMLSEAGAADEAADQLTGPNSSLLQTVSKVILEDLTQVKDNLDLFVRSEQRDVSQLKPLSDTLAQMADTLAMLGLGVQRKTIQDQVNLLDQMTRGERAPEDGDLMEVAGALLGIEASLHDLGHGGQMEADEAGDEATEDRTHIPEFRQVMGQTIGEIKAELGRIKDAVTDFSVGPAVREGLAEVPGFLHNIRGSLTILDMGQAAELVDECRAYVENELLARDTPPSPADLDSLADAITSIEYYLESIDERWGHPSAILEVAAQSLAQLAKAGIIEPAAPAMQQVPTAAPEEAPRTDADDTQIMAVPEFPDTMPAGVADEPAADDTQIMPVPEFPETSPSMQNDTGMGLSLEPLETEPATPDLDFTQTKPADSLTGEEAGVVPGESPMDKPTEEIQILALDDVPEEVESAPAPTELAGDEITGTAPSDDAGELARRLSDALEVWFSWPTDTRATQILRDTIESVKQAAETASVSAAGKIAGDMDAMVVHIAAGQDALNDDVRHTLAWARDTLIQQLAAMPTADEQTIELATDESAPDLDITLASPAEPVSPSATESMPETSTPPAPAIEPDFVPPPEPAPASTPARAPISEDIDDEIIAIFMEEAEEELANIGRLFPQWRNNLQDNEALRDLRRSFHTLKGSGRLVGAADVGEFAWAFENLLNRVIDKTIEPGEQLMALLEQAHATLPGLLELFAKGATPGRDVFNLMEQAEALSQGREPTLPRGVAAEPAASAPAAEPVAPAAETESETPSTPQAPSIAQAPPVTDKAAPPADTVAKGPEPDAVALRVPDIDPVLLDIYRNEAASHLDAVRAFIEACREQHGACPVSDELIRALHTLCGSSRTAGVVPVAELGRDLEYFAKLLQEKGFDVGADGLVALEEGMTYIDKVMTLLGSVGAALPEQADQRERIAAMHAAAQSRPAQVRGAEPVEAPPVPVRVEPEPAADYDEELLEIFLEEGEEILDTSDNLLQQWIAAPEQSDLVEGLQRELHTLKGGARMAGIAEIGDLSHKLESLLTAVADGHVDTSKRMFDVLQLAQDRLARMLEDVRDRKPAGRADDLIVTIEELLPGGGGGKSAASEGRILAPDAVEEVDGSIPLGAPAAKPAESQQPEADPAEQADVTPADAVPTADVSMPTEPTPAESTPLESVPVESTPLESIPAEPVKDEPRAEAASVKTGLPAAPASSARPSEESATERSGELTASTGQAEAARSAPKQQPERTEPVSVAPETGPTETGPGTPSGQLAPPLQRETAGSATADRVEDEAGRERRTGPRIQQEQIRVRADLLDNLVNFAGEVSIYRSRLEQQVNSFRYNLTEFDDTVARLREQLRQFEIATEAQIQYRYEEAGARGGEDFDPLEFDRFTHMQQLSRSMLESLSDLDSLKGLLGSLTRESETLLVQQSRVNTELQEGLMRSRMVPFSGQAARLRRIVRQVAQELGKEAELVLNGAEHELDRTVLDRVMAPIEHMLRNAVAHGIETPAQRHAAGKRAGGQITIGLSREGSEVVIRVMDDGAGIDLDAIRRKAQDRGRATPGSVLSEEDLLDMILESGFSTAKEVTQIAGRGVGMDVVSSEIKQLGGSLGIDTRKGKGTMFTVRLPLTLSVTRALMVSAGEDTYAIPLLSIEGIERLSHEELERLYAADKPVYNWLGQEYTFLHLGQALGVGDPSLPGEGRKSPILLTRSGDSLAALHVDGLIGSREVVVKPVGPQLSHLRGISGATIMGDGTVALILDLGVLVRLGKALEGPTPAPQPAQIVQLPTVMVVDDSITVRKVTTRLLERHNIQVLTAKDGVEALALLQEQVPDVLLLDIEMPRMDGYELATNVRNDDRLKHIPIIMITSRTGDKHRDRAMHIGVNRYMGKPFQEHDLLDNIQALLAGSA